MQMTGVSSDPKRWVSLSEVLVEAASPFIYVQTEARRAKDVTTRNIVLFKRLLIIKVMFVGLHLKVPGIDRCRRRRRDQGRSWRCEV